MKKNALIRELKEKTGATQGELRTFFKSFLGAVGNSISADQKVIISGLGSFEVRERKPKKIVDPNNPFETIVLPKRKVVKFIAGKTIKDDLRAFLKNRTTQNTVSDSDKVGSEEISKKPTDAKLIKPKSFFAKFKIPPLMPKKYSYKKSEELPKPSQSENILKPNQNEGKNPKKSIDDLVKEIAQEVEKKDHTNSAPVQTQKIAAPPKIHSSSPQTTPDKETGVVKPLPPSAIIPEKGSASSLPNLAPKKEDEFKALPPNQVKPQALASAQPQIQPQPQTKPPVPTIKKTMPFADIKAKAKFVSRPKPSPSSQTPETDKAKQTTAGINIPYIDLSKKNISKKILSKIPEYIARLYQAVPVDIDEQSKKLIVAMVDPEDYQAIEFIKKKTGYQIEPKLATNADVGRVLDQYSGIEAEVESAISGTEFSGAIKEIKTEAPTEKKEEVSSEAPTSRVVQSILRRAVSSKASDIHIEPEETAVIIRFRIDGVLQKVITLPKQIQAAIISRIKILSGMKIDEQRLPQDGRFETKLHDRDIDFRVSTFPTVNGEKVVMRILDKSSGILSLEELGVQGEGFKRLDDGVKKSHGMTLVTGPTGSGKTTTLYALIDRIMNVGINIVTLEDPVEYQIKGINQGQVRSDIGFTFAKGLRSIVRQDPDVIMVGEIRDLETAEMAVHSALTGHIVLSTLHTNDAAGAIPRLVDMGVEPFLITSSLATVVGQRLARKLCDQCKQETKVSPEILKEIEEEIAKMPVKEKGKIKEKELKFYKGKGCPACDDSGYKGRIGVFEVLSMSPEVEKLTLKKSSSELITEQAIKEGMLTMKQDGIIKCLEGKTTIEEVWRVTKE